MSLKFECAGVTSLISKLVLPHLRHVEVAINKRSFFKSNFIHYITHNRGIEQ